MHRCPQRVMSSVANIINMRREELCMEEEPGFTKVLKEMCNLREKIENLQNIIEGAKPESLSNLNNKSA